MLAELPHQLFFHFNYQKLFALLVAIAWIQLISSVTLRFFGPRLGALIAGFAAGFISSTGLTITLAKKSLHLDQEHLRLESSSFLTATLAMLLEGFLLCFIALDGQYHQVYQLFAVNILVAILLLLFRHQRTKHIRIQAPPPALFDWKALLKLTLIIGAILMTSQLLLLSFGQKGLSAITFLASLFEVHGTTIATTQMYLSQRIDSDIFVWLIFLGFQASYLSKLGLVLIFGHSALKRRVLLWIISLSISHIFTYALIH